MQGSEYSPAQTRANSRRSSWISTRRPSTKGSGRAGKEKQGSRAPSRVGQVPEIDGDDDVVNGKPIGPFLSDSIKCPTDSQF